VHRDRRCSLDDKQMKKLCWHVGKARIRDQDLQESNTRMLDQPRQEVAAKLEVPVPSIKTMCIGTKSFIFFKPVCPFGEKEFVNRWLPSLLGP
jgi:hypothetical protein